MEPCYAVLLLDDTIDDARWMESTERREMRVVCRQQYMFCAVRDGLRLDKSLN
jgi:hypothetical protein